MKKQYMHRNFALKLFVGLVIISIITACNSGDSKNVETEQLVATNNQIVLSTEQFKSSGMQLGTIQQVNFPVYITSNGSIDVPPEGKATVSTFYAGYVKSISLLPGDKVKKGQAVLTLENPEYLEMQQAYLEAQSKLAYLKADYERQKTLNSEKIASNKRFMKAESDYKVTLIGYKTLGKKLEMMNINPRKISASNLTSIITLYAPISGFITKVDARKGTLLTPSTEAFEIINTGHIHLELRAFEKDVLKIKQGQPIIFKIPANGDIIYEAEVHLVGKKVAGESRVVEIHGHLKNEDESSTFLPGMYIEAKIEIESDKVYALPETAVINMGTKSYILVLTKQKEGNYYFNQHEVQIGKTTDNLVEIKVGKNLSKQNKVLVQGAFNLIKE
ncbi:MAG: efflux RND transporter periplasmic adaptor subunit [Cyclobacteriaceae bacterium]|nr:efflux RND transporter periplasmic adaptor subunit [Cyclobacteriaceae bacterium]